MSIAESHQHYIPAAGQSWALPLYDPLTKLIGADRARREVPAYADLQGARRVLDIGCGTGTLAVQIKREHPALDVVGLDPDPDALARARRKATRAALPVRFDQGVAGALPYEDGTFDRVLSSFRFHHLREGEKRGMLREVRRVLAPGGFLLLLDFAGPDARAGLVTRLIQSHAYLRDNVEERILALMAGAGLRDPVRIGSRALLVGRVHYYRAWQEA